MTQPHTLPPDWQPRPDDIEHAKSRGICDAQFADLHQSFVEYWTNTKNGRKVERLDWSRTFKVQWINKATPWSHYQKEQRGHAEPEKAWYEHPSPLARECMAQTAEVLDDARPRNMPKPRVRRMPGPAWTKEQSEAWLAEMREDEKASRWPKKKITPRRVPMSAAAKQRLRDQGLPVPDEEMEG